MIFSVFIFLSLLIITTPFFGIVFLGIHRLNVAVGPAMAFILLYLIFQDRKK